jgi:uncharacterized protein YacL
MAPPDPPPSGSHRTPAYAFRIAALGILVAAGVFLVLMYLFSEDIDGAVMVSAMSTLFAVIGTIIGAYFGIKVTNDNAEKTQAAIKEANDKETEAFGALDPAEAQRILEERRQNR